MTAPRHLMILASAGTGKTYSLTNRFVALLARGARPERIVALTFTRKAAGEFFDEILKKLADAAADETQARRIAGEIGHPTLKAADFGRFLHAMVAAMPRLQLGTLDSFFARIARAFPLELGLSGEFEILQEHSAQVERRRVLRRLFARAGNLDAGQRDFIEAFKRATFGRDEKRLTPQLDRFLDDHHEAYLSAPDAAAWGQPDRIWPAGRDWPARQRDVADAIRRLRRWLDQAAPPEKQRRRWEAFLDEAGSWVPGAEMGKALVYVLGKAIDARAELAAGAVIEFDRLKQTLDAPAGAALLELTAHLLASETDRRLEMTRGLHAVLRAYETAYDAGVRRAGRLTFADVQRLLAPAAGAPPLSDEPGVDRLFIDFRLDAGIDHWLLDEFQDTSFAQWGILKNLIDEVVQDPDGIRSFFCVGDVKQAIYSWREGDPRLFGQIYHHYQAATGGEVGLGHLDLSQRSGPAIIAMVNQVFGSAQVIAGLFPGPVSESWNSNWRSHQSAREERNGHAVWLTGSDVEARRKIVLSLLGEIQPLQRGLTCAILVQTNRLAVELAAYLREAGGVAAVAESDLSVCTDNPLGAAMLGLLQAAAHPGDTLAWEHVRMTPVFEIARERGVGDRDALVLRLLQQVHGDGFAATLADWLRAAERHLAPDDRFSRERGRQLVEAARKFDETGSRDVGEFVAFMRRYTIREPEGASVVRVMTLHKAKGLGFDVVLLPDLEGERLDQARGGLSVHRADDRSIEWVLLPPPQLVRDADAVLAAHHREAEADAGYEALSLLYVGFTRAKRGLYVVASAPEKSTSRNYPKLLAQTLRTGPCRAPSVQVGAATFPSEWSSGDPGWFEAFKVETAQPEQWIRFAPVGDRKVGRRLRSIQPSAKMPLGEGTWFSLRGGEATEFGRAVHRLLAEIEWWPPQDPAPGWVKRGEPASAIAEAEAVLLAERLRSVWAKPDGTFSEVWRERAIEEVVGDDWISGVMDRVVVERGADGRAVRACIYDFKTDRLGVAAVGPATERYRMQLEAYRRSVQRLTGLERAAVGACVVWTETRELVVLD